MRAHQRPILSFRTRRVKRSVSVCSGCFRVSSDGVERKRWHGECVECSKKTYLCRIVPLKRYVELTSICSKGVANRFLRAPCEPRTGGTNEKNEVLSVVVWYCHAGQVTSWADTFTGPDGTVVAPGMNWGYTNLGVERIDWQTYSRPDAEDQYYITNNQLFCYVGPCTNHPAVYNKVQGGYGR